MMRVAIAAYLVLSGAMAFAALQLHFVAAGMWVRSEASYQRSLTKVCLKDPTFHLCGDYGREPIGIDYARWVSRFAL